MVAAAKMQRSCGCDYHHLLAETDNVPALREMEQFHSDCIARIKRRLAEIDPARHPLAGKPPFSERARRRRGWNEGVTIVCLSFCVGLVSLAGLAHVGRLLWDAITG